MCSHICHSHICSCVTYLHKLSDVYNSVISSDLVSAFSHKLYCLVSDVIPMPASPAPAALPFYIHFYIFSYRPTEGDTILGLRQLNQYIFQHVEMDQTEPHGWPLFKLSDLNQEKRAPYEFGIGKRSPYNFGIGKRFPKELEFVNWTPFYNEVTVPNEFLMGKRSPSEFDIRKRSTYKRSWMFDWDQFSRRKPYNFGVGRKK